jgi:hypothetical protein
VIAPGRKVHGTRYRLFGGTYHIPVVSFQVYSCSLRSGLPPRPLRLRWALHARRVAPEH